MADIQAGTELTNQSTGFSEDYVKSLREEAASWRTKFRQLEAQQVTKDIEIKLAQKGIKAKPSWVELQEGQSVDEAIENFAKENPHLMAAKVEPSVGAQDTGSIQKQIQTKQTPQFSPPTNAPTTNVETKDLNQMLANRSLTDAKDDPKTRAQIRDWYRTQLRAKHLGGSN